jgi:hypothetical protein
MDIRSAAITIWNNKAYLPTPARYVNEGPFTNLEPIHIVNPTQSELVPLVQKMLSKKPEILPNPTLEEIKFRRDLLPKATGARSWKRLSQNGIAYGIVLTEKGLTLEISELDRKGRWIFPLEKQINFPASTDLSIVIQAMLDDHDKRPK